VSSDRIWIGGYGAFPEDDSDYDALLTWAGIELTTETPTYMAHDWDTGWFRWPWRHSTRTASA
jgi:hypothetical protein